MICIDGNFPKDYVSFYNLHGVETPVEHEEYTIRETVNHSNGKIGYRLNEILNPEVPIKHPILGVIMYEPSFDSERFAEFNISALMEEKELVAQY